MRYKELKQYASYADHDKITFRFLGLRRSGNHGVISWVIQNVAGTEKIFFNNCKAGHNPLIRFPQAQMSGKYAGIHQKAAYIKLLSDDESYLSQADALFCSYEDIDLKWLDHPANQPLSLGCEGSIKTNVYILRDFSNWFASFWAHLNRKKGAKNLDATQPLHFFAEITRMSEIWKQNLIRVQDSNYREKHNLKIIRYDDWATSADYRKTLLTDLELPGTTVDIPEVSTFGGGSSFDGLSKQSNPNQMKTTQRWVPMLELPQFNKVIRLLLDDPEFCKALETAFPDSYYALTDTLKQAA
jgi:hypothetical protein